MKFRLSISTVVLLMFALAPFTLAQAPSGTTDPTAPDPRQASPRQTGPGQTVPTGDPGITPGAPQSGSQSDSANPQSGQPAPAPAVQPADPSKVKHDGGKDDVDAVGNRKMGGRGLGNWYSIESDIKMGKQYAQMVDSSSKMISDPIVTEYVNRLGQNLVRNSDAQVPFTFKVIDSDVINAFSLPGGFVYVNSGTILAADEEAELAGVMAHEIAHVCARHATRQLTRSQYANFATIPLIFVGGGIGYAAYEAMGLGLPVAFMSFQRGFEAEADYLGLQYDYKTGYDPQAYISFFEKIQAQEKKKPGFIDKTFASHPQTPDRIEASQKEIATILPARAEYTVSTSEFDEVKARLASIENRRKMVDQKDVNKPTLRRTSTADQTGKDAGSTDDGHPTLKRRDDN
ncbi:MAG: M48 family metallopeptidase [Terriglobales bacterium]